MSKITLNTLSTLRNDASAINLINANFQAIADFLENTFSRDGTSPNTLEATLDANANRIVNLPAPTSNTEPVRLIDLPNDSAALINAIADAEGFADDAATSASAASTSASAASSSASAASTSASTATTQASAASASASAAAASAANVGNSLLATSTTSLAIGTGSKVFTTQSGKAFQTGQYVMMVSSANPTVNYMFGDVTSYTGTTLTVNSTVIGGSGTKTDWIISISGLQGPTGPTGATGASGAGSGDVVHSGTVADGNLTVWNGTSGTSIKDGGTITTFAKTFLDDAAATNVRTTLGLAIGTDVQAWNAKLDFLNTSSAATATAFRTLLGLVIGTDVQAFDAELTALAGLTSAADKIPYFTGAGTAATADFTSFGRLLVANADAAAARTDLGLGTAATLNVGTTALQVVQLDAAAKLPAVDGSQLTGVTSSGVITLTAGGGLTGGGTSNNLSIAMATPGTLTASTPNATGGAGGSHTHNVSLTAADVIPAGASSVGAYIIGLPGTTVTIGNNISGTNLRYSNVGNGSGAVINAGTWKCHSNTTNSALAGLFQRIS